MSTKRISLNILATYTQTLVSMVIGLFCSRWVYNALGETQFGLFALVGSLITFIAILNSTLIGTSGRFFAFALGQQHRPDADKELLCKWFNTALCVQAILPAVVATIGAPAGTYVIMHVLNIPPELRLSCVYVFYFSLFSVFVSMLFSPVQALYYAKQYIFVKNLFGILSTLLLAVEGWWLLHYSGNRLVAHAAVTTALMLLINIAIAVFARWHFPEARIRPRYWFNWHRLKELFSFSSFWLFGTLGRLLGSSGVAIVLNKFIGPAANAAMGIGNQVFYKTSVVSQAVSDAISPELTTRVGAGQIERAKQLTVRACLYSTCMGLLVAAPLIAYAGKVLTLWLKHPPQFAAEILVIMMLNLLAERMTVGYSMLVQATGRIKRFTTFLGIGNAGRCATVLALLVHGLPLIPTLWLGWFLPYVILNQMRVWFANRILGISIRQYLRRVFAPLLLIAGGSFAFSFGFKALAGESVWTILTCSALNAVIVGSLVWSVSGPEERRHLLSKLMAASTRLFRRSYGE